MMYDMDTECTNIAQRREAFRRERMAVAGVAERTQQLHDSAARVEPGLLGAVSVVTGESVDELRRLGF